MKIALINPNIVTQKGDVSGSGIPYMPIGLAYLAGYLRSFGHEIHVIDAFGESPWQVRSTKTHYIQGLSAEKVARSIPGDIEVIAFYAHLTVAHESLLEIICQVKNLFPKVFSLVLENTDKVNAYSLRQVYPDFFAQDIDYIVLEYLERRTQRLLDAINSGSTSADVDGIISRSSNGCFLPPIDAEKTIDLDKLPFPAWDLFPIKNYWRLGYAHGPLTTRRYLPLLTSRGCPYNCGFCVAPEITNGKWTARSAVNVVDEIVHFQKEFNVNEFHIEDLNPTLDKKRMQDISRLLIERGIRIIWKLAQGTKLESLDNETVRWMAAAGCTYISISPESGSRDVIKLMNKSVDHEYAVKMVRAMRQSGIYTQACFVLGYPGEREADWAGTSALVRRLAKAGVDEVAVFIITPMPGAHIYRKFDRMSGPDNFSSLAQLTFTPKWRSDYRRLAFFRKKLYFQYIAVKLVYHPARAFGYGWAFLTRRFKTKVEMTIFRKIRVAWFFLLTEVGRSLSNRRNKL